MRPEVAVLGAGPVGCALALLLQRAGLPVTLCTGGRTDAAHAPPLPRPIALSHASRLLLERAGAWPALQPTPIRDIHVSQAGRCGQTRIAAADAGVPALGYVLDYGELAEALLAVVHERAIAVVESPPAQAALRIHAEGRSAQAREVAYGQEALVALVESRPAAGGTAYERFTAEGPLALLPLAGRHALVWAMSPGRAAALSAAGEAAFLAALGEAFGARAGVFVSAGPRIRFPLALRVRAARVGEREAYVGNAAQTLHPVAGQGLNLGLRDARDLARLLRDAGDPGDARLLARYAAMRKLDAAATIRMTDLLACGFAGASPLAGAASGIAMTALDAFAPARRFFARRMIFGSSAMP